MINKYLTQFLQIVLILLSVYLSFLVLSYHWETITDPNPQAYREGAGMSVTQDLVDGKNPFDIENMPQSNYNYGILYSLIVLPLAKVFGVNLFVHRLVSFIFLVLSCCVFSLALHKAKIKKYYWTPAIIILYMSLLFGDHALVKPDTLGEFLFLGCLIVPYYFDFGRKSLLVSIVLGLLIRYTKAYFLLAPLFVCLYLVFFKSKKEGFFYGLIYGSLFILSELVVNNYCNMYFLTTFWVYINQSEISGDFQHLMYQLFFLVKFNLGFIISTIIALGVLLNRKEFISSLKAKLKTASFGSAMNFSNLEKGLFNFRLPFMRFLLILIFLLFYFLLGRHRGTFMGYQLQLLTPFILIVVLALISFVETKVSKNFFMLMVIGNLGIMYLYTNLDHYTCNEWDRLREIISENEEILNSPLVAPILITEQRKMYDSGHPEFYINVNHNNKFHLDKVLPDSAAIDQMDEKYRDDIRNKIINKKFDVIMFPSRIALDMGFNMIQEYYYCSEKLDVCMSHNAKDRHVQIWKPKL